MRWKPETASSVRAAGRCALPALLTAAFSFKLYYLFYCSGYRDHLVSDTAGYWWRAVRRYDGDVFSLSQWTAWPATPHYLIFGVFKLLTFFHLEAWRLEAVLVLFAFLTSLSAAFVYLIVKDVAQNKALALAAAGLYAFSYPIIYLNTFVLSENFAIPLLPAVCWLVLVRHEKNPELFAAGLLFGLAAAVRPNLLALSAPFAVYLLFSGPLKAAAKKAAVFLASFCLVVFMVVVQNHYISRGELKTFTPNGGYSFFIQQCKPYQITSTYRGRGNFTHPSFAFQPERGQFLTERPWHDQAYFFKLGFECLASDPVRVLGENFALLGNLFWGPLFPYFPRAAGFAFWMPFFNFTTFFIFMTLPFVFVFPPGRPKFGKMLLLVSVPVFNAAPLFFLSVDQRYLFPCLFALYAAFFSYLPELWKARRWVIAYWLAVASAFAGLEAADLMRHRLLKRAFGREDVRVVPMDRAVKPKERGLRWNAWGNLILIPPDRPIFLENEKGLTAAAVEISADCNDEYLMAFYDGNTRLGDVRVPIAVIPGCGLETRVLSLPPELQGKTFDGVLVQAGKNDGRCSVGHVRFIGPRPRAVEGP